MGSWGRLGAVLGSSWSVLEPSWVVSGRLGVVLGPSWAVLGSFGSVLGQLGTILGRLGPSWASRGARPPKGGAGGRQPRLPASCPFIYLWASGNLSLRIF